MPDNRPVDFEKSFSVITQYKIDCLGVIRPCNERLDGCAILESLMSNV